MGSWVQGRLQRWLLSDDPVGARRPAGDGRPASETHFTLLWSPDSLSGSFTVPLT